MNGMNLIQLEKKKCLALFSKQRQFAWSTVVAARNTDVTDMT